MTSSKGNSKKAIEDIKKSQHRTELVISDIRKDLSYHIKRTDILEAEFKPIKTHVAVVGALSKIIVVLFSVGAASAAIWKVFIQ